MHIGALVGSFGGIGGTCRRIEQYAEPFLEWMTAVGTAPSADGARAPLSDISPHLGKEVQKLSTVHTNVTSHSCLEYGFKESLCVLLIGSFLDVWVRRIVFISGCHLVNE